MKSGEYRIVFGKDVYTNEAAYGSTALWKKAGSSLIVGEKTYRKLVDGDDVRTTYVAGHGVYLGVIYNIKDVKKIYQLVEQRVY